MTSVSEEPAASFSSPGMKRRQRSAALYSVVPTQTPPRGSWNVACFERRVILPHPMGSSSAVTRHEIHWVPMAVRTTRHVTGCVCRPSVHHCHPYQLEHLSPTAVTTTLVRSCLHFWQTSTNQNPWRHVDKERKNPWLGAVVALILQAETNSYRWAKRMIFHSGDCTAAG
jgi:hypothetical protein